jgi:hypothetical protein
MHVEAFFLSSFVCSAKGAFFRLIFLFSRRPFVKINKGIPDIFVISQNRILLYSFTSLFNSGV